nr:M14 family metallopeptidase [Allomuricauda sp.]
MDTKDKKISLQERKTYEFKDMGVWVDNKFDGARLNGAVQLNDSTIQLQINPENTPINKSPYYAFKTWSDSPRTIYFNLTYPEGFEHRYIPKKKQNGTWTVMDTLAIVKTENGAYLKLNLSQEVQTIAGQEINSSKDVKAWYEGKLVQPHDFVRSQIVGQSALGRDIPVLDMYHGRPEGKPIVVLMTRQHPPEVTGYFAYQHFLEALVNQGDLTESFFNRYRVLAFPNANPDGVDLGHWRHNANGVDLNRDWSKYRQVEVENIAKFIVTASKNDQGKIVLGLDFHSTYEDVFYTNVTREGTTLPTFIDDWFELLEQEISDYEVNEQASDSTRPVSKGWFLYGHNATSITYEIGDHTPKDRIGEIGTKSAVAMMKILLEEK